MDGKIVIDVELGTKSFEQEIERTEQYLIKLQHSYEKAMNQKGKLKPSEEAMAKLRLEIEKTNNKLTELRKKQYEIDRANLNNFKDNIDNVGNSINGVVTKIGRWALALFGIRSAYSFIRQSMSTLSQYNEQMATDIEYIRFALASILQPVIERIIQLVYKLLAYVGYLAKAWFNVDLFANASAKAFNKTSKAIGGANKNAKELKKTLTGFDKLNILNEDGTVGALGGIGGIELPSVDLSEWQNVEIPKWLEWIKDHGEFIGNILKIIAAAILAIKFNLGLIGFLGLTVVIEGIVNLVKDLKTYLDNPTWNNFSKVLADIGVTLAGFGIIFGLTNPIGQILLIISAIVIAIADLIQNIETLKWLIENPSWENFGKALRRWLDSAGLLGKGINLLIDSVNKETKATNLLTQAEENLKKARDNLKTATDNYVRAVDDAEEALKRLKEAEENTGISGEELYKKVQNGTLNYKNMTTQQREVYKAYLNNINAQDELTYRTNLLTEVKKEEQKQSILNELQTLEEAKSYDTYKEKVVQAFNDGKISAEEAKDLINSAMRSMSQESQKTFVQDLPNDIKDGLNPTKYQSAWSKFKNAWNNFFNGLASTVHITSSGTYSGGGSRGFATGGLAYYKPVKLATGAVINQPGRGVPISKALGGEAGAEGIIPLTDESALEKIGSTIGKHTKISADITLELESRILARVMKEINSDRSFARNGG